MARQSRRAGHIPGEAERLQWSSIHFHSYRVRTKGKTSLGAEGPKEVPIGAAIYLEGNVPMKAREHTHNAEVNDFRELDNKLA